MRGSGLPGRLSPRGGISGRWGPGPGTSSPGREGRPFLRCWGLRAVRRRRARHTAGRGDGGGQGGRAQAPCSAVGAPGRPALAVGPPALRTGPWDLAGVSAVGASSRRPSAVPPGRGAPGRGRAAAAAAPPSPAGQRSARRTWGWRGGSGARGAGDRAASGSARPAHPRWRGTCASSQSAVRRREAPGAREGPGLGGTLLAGRPPAARPCHFPCPRSPGATTGCEDPARMARGAARGEARQTARGGPQPRRPGPLGAVRGSATPERACSSKSDTVLLSIQTRYDMLNKSIISKYIHFI